MSATRYKDAISFEKRHRGKAKKYPYFYSLIPKGAEFLDGSGITVSGGPRWIALNANDKIDVAVPLDDDSIFQMNFCKFNVRDLSGNLGVGGVNHPPRPEVNETALRYADQVLVKMYSQSSGTRELISGASISTIQGSQGGMAMTRHPFMFPQSGLVSISFENQTGVNLQLTGFLFGYKVAF